MSEFEILLEQCKTALGRYVRYRIPDRSDADDVMQEIRLAAFLRHDGLRDKERFKSWLIGIARNKCADYFRSRRETVSIDDLPETELVQSRYGIAEPSPVRETIDLLGDKDRQILRLFYYDELPQAEIAKRLGIPAGTVKSRLYAARRNFKNRYPYPPKGEDTMFKLPEIIPEYKITPSEKPPFPIKWEEIMGWFCVPKMGEKLAWAIYDQPSRRGDYYYEMEVVGKAEVHGIEGVELVAREKNFDKSKPCTDRNFVAQLTDTHCRYLAESHVADGVRKLHTFLDGDDFLPNWGFGEDNCGNETNLAPKGDITRNGSAVTSKDKPFLLDIAGRYNVSINGRNYDTVCVMDIGTYNNGIVSEQFIDQKGRTVLWRRFNRNDWAIDRYGKLWTEQLPKNETLTVNGSTYVHWYDCITDYIFR